jgi:16S rRNA (adenine1518-N6/adenine1519-N6)-dimethyltransferase
MPRRLGQHFLNNRSVLTRIAEAACPQPCPLILEIGPGTGSLTRHLLERAERVVAIELDPALAGRLAGLSNRLEVVQADVLAADLTRWGPAAVTGNLPYYITSPIVEKVLGMGELLRQFVCLVQREVAERMIALPGSRDYGYFSVSVQSRSEVQRLFTVPPGAFSPPPKVYSTVVKMVPKPHIYQPISKFLDFAGLCFARKRKTLRNNLENVYKYKICRLPEASLRAEQLSVTQLADLYRKLSSEE